MKVKGKVEGNAASGAQTLPPELSEKSGIARLLQVYRLGSRLLEGDSEAGLNDLLVEVMSCEFDTSTVSIMVLNEQSGMLEIVASRGFTDEQVASVRIPPGECVAGWVYTQNRPLLLPGDSSLPYDFTSTQSKPTISSAISFPIRNKEKVTGVINISRIDEASVYADRDVDLVSTLSQLTAMAIDNLRLKENQGEAVRIKTLLEQFVSSGVARLLIDKKHDLHEIGTIEDLTVVFADLRNFTSLVQSLELQKLRSFLDDFFTLTAEEVQRDGGMVNKFLGDGVLIIFGAPLHHANPAVGAVQAAQRIHLLFKRMCDRYFRENRLFGEISLGVGIGSGEVFIGNVGSPKRFDYTVVGVPVNLAQRLASQASGDTILITDAVKREGGSEIRTINTRNIRLKGFPEQVLIHEVAHPPSD